MAPESKSSAAGSGGGGYSGGGGSGGGSYRPSAGNAVYQGIQGANAAFNRVPFASQYRDSQAGAVVALMEMSPMGWAGNYALQHTTGMGFADSLRLFGVNQDSGWYTSGYIGTYIASMITPGGWGAGGIRAAVLGGKAALKLGGLKGLGAFAANGARSAVRSGWQSARNTVSSCLAGRPNSFIPGTRVLMANGSSQAIEDIEVGDTVLATDPESGEQEAKIVLATITGSGNKHLVEITVDTTTEKPAGENGDRDSAPGPSVVGDTIIATDGHPFWVPELGEWVDAENLTPGTWLHTSAGTWIQIAAVREWIQSATVHNLTVKDIHTYHVQADSVDVLVHNCPPVESVQQTEVYANRPLKPQEAVDAWEDFLGPGPYSDSHPRTGVSDPNRLVSVDGMRSIRFGGHEMGSSPTKFHYHEEVWSFISPMNSWVVNNTVVRVPLQKR